MPVTAPAAAIRKNTMKKIPQRTIAVLLIITIVLPLESAFAARAASPLRQSEKARQEEILRSLEYNKYFFERKRDPVFAGILSWYVPGLGQYYSGEIWKGTAFLVSEYTLMLCAVFYFLNFDFNAGGGTGFKISVDAKRTDLGVVETSRAISSSGCWRAFRAPPVQRLRRGPVGTELQYRARRKAPEAEKRLSFFIYR
jgi:TM2 domain-containing membrane protein YozV